MVSPSPPSKKAIGDTVFLLDFAKTYAHMGVIPASCPAFLGHFALYSAALCPNKINGQIAKICSLLSNHGKLSRFSLDK